MRHRTNQELAEERKEHRIRRPDLAKANAQRYLERHPEYRARQAERIRQWIKENPEKFAEANRKWRDENAEAMRYYTANYRSKKRSNGGEISRGLEQLLMSEQGCKCPYCHRDLRQTGYDLDHYIPVDSKRLGTTVSQC